MCAARLMFVEHTGQIAGAELILLDVVQRWKGASAFLFEDGPLARALRDRQLKVMLSRSGRGLAQIRRDSSLLKAIPLIGRLGSVVIEIARAARAHDIVYANSQKAFVLAALATLLVRRPLIWHLHDIISAAHFGKLQRRVQVFLANRCAAKVIVPSRAAADAFVAEGGRADLIEIIANGLDLPAMQSQPADLRHELGLPEGPLVGVFSRLAAWKGQHVVVQALARLSEVNCIIVGDALFGEQAYAGRLTTMVDNLGLAGRIHFLGHRADVPKLMRAVDVMVHPSIAPEPFGRTLVEAMLAGVPVIATDTGAASDILDAGRAGSLVPPDDAEALAQAITRVLANDGLRPRLEYATARAKAHYGMDRMLDSIGLVINRVAIGLPA